MKRSDINIVLPAYNEAKVLDKVIRQLKDGGFNRIYLIDDGSTDSTVDIAQNNRVKTISHIVNRGAGAASQTAIEFAKKNDWPAMILMDADGQHHVEDIDNLLEYMASHGSDIVIGNRFIHSENQIPASRIYFNRIANGLTNFFCQKTYNDTQSGFRLLNRKAIASLDLKVDGFGFCSEMIIVGEKVGLKIDETPIHVKYTDYSMSKGQSFGSGVSTAFNFLWRMIFN